MEAVDIKKMDEVFGVERPLEHINASEAMKLIGSVIRKTASSDLFPPSKDVYGKARTKMQRIFILAKCVEAWASDESEEAPEEIGIPTDLLKAIREDADGEDADVIPISEAIRKIGDAIDPQRAETKKTDEVKKEELEIAELVIQNVEDLNELADDNEEVDWGPDPDWSKYS